MVKEFIKSITPSCLLRYYYKVKKFKYLTLGRGFTPGETSKAKPRRLREGFFEKYCAGKGLDIGFGGDPVVQTCQCFDWEHGDAQDLGGIPGNTYDFIYSSHTLEHVADPAAVLQIWWGKLKKNGYLILYVPDRDLYEKKKSLPSRWNPSHKNYFVIKNHEPPDTLGLVSLIQENLPESAVIYAKQCAEGHTITDPLIHSDGEFSIEIVVLKKS
ncbi:MAG: methyltransferase domain-containing protein [bacterium]